MSIKIHKILICYSFLFLFAGCNKDPVKIDMDNNMQQKDPVAHYKFNGNANDQSKFENNGTFSGVVLKGLGLENEGLAGYFKEAYVEIPDKDILDFSTNKLTVSAWIKPEVTSGSYIVGKTSQVYAGGTISQGGGPFSLDIFPGTARALIYGEDMKDLAILTGISDIQYNFWQHLALTWDGKTARLYYNGRVEAEQPFDKPIIHTNSNVYIGAYKFVFPAASFVGSIDNVRIYNRCLKEEEIIKLYTNYQ